MSNLSSKEETYNMDQDQDLGGKHYSRCSSAGSTHTPNSSAHNSGRWSQLPLLLLLFVWFARRAADNEMALKLLLLLMLRAVFYYIARPVSVSPSIEQMTTMIAAMPDTRRRQTRTLH